MLTETSKLLLKRSLALIFLVSWGLALYGLINFFGKSFQEFRVIDKRINRELKLSKSLGRVVKIAPFAAIVKLKEYSGWKDEYNYLLFQNPKGDDAISSQVVKSRQLDAYTNFKVIELKADYARNEIVCILENEKIENEKVVVPCSDLGKIEEVTDIYEKSSQAILKDGYSFIAIASEFPKYLEKVAHVNQFEILKLTSLSELDELFTYPVHVYGWEYGEIIYRLPVFIENGQKLDEKFLSYLMFTEIRREDLSDTSLSNYLFGRKINENADKWIRKSIGDSQKRWALFSIAIFLERFILNQEIKDPYVARRIWARFNELKQCLSPLFNAEGPLEKYSEELKAVMFDLNDMEQFERFVQFVQLSKSLDNKYLPEKTGCAIYRWPDF